jgi:hypothetical protein
MVTSIRFCLLMLVQAALVAGCARDFGPPAPLVTHDKLANNTPCADAGACASDACQDGYCCDRVCAQNEHCNLPGSGGTCTFNPTGTTACDAGSQCAPGNACQDGRCCDRVCASYERCDLLGTEGRCTAVPLATPCDAGSQCAPPGACVDGICCERACGACQGCSPFGRCVDAADNTDPHADCLPGGGACLACFRGACAPALRGTDPHGACGLDHVCGGEPRCFAADGGACADDADCLEGTCLNGRCLTVDLAPFFAGQMNPDATERDAPALAVSRYGALAVTFREMEATTTHTGDFFITEDSLMAGVRTRGGTWQVALVANLIDAAPDLDFESAVVFQGEQPLLLLADVSSGCGASGRTCVLQRRALSPSARPGPPTDLVPEPAFPDGGRFTRTDTAQFLAVVPGTSVVVQGVGEGVRFLEPAEDGGWSAVYRTIATPLGPRLPTRVSALQWQGEPAVLVLTSATGGTFDLVNGLLLLTREATYELSFDPQSCDIQHLTELDGRDVGGALRVTWSCSDTDPRLTFLDVTPLPDGGATQVAHPAGGFSDYRWDLVRPLADSPSLTLASEYSPQFVYGAAEVWLYGEGMTQGRLVGLAYPSVGDGEEHLRQVAATPDPDGLPQVLFNTRDLNYGGDLDKLYFLSVHR